MLHQLVLVIIRIQLTQVVPDKSHVHISRTLHKFSEKYVAHGRFPKIFALFNSFRIMMHLYPLHTYTPIFGQKLTRFDCKKFMKHVRILLYAMKMELVGKVD